VATIQNQLHNYAMLRELVDRWVDQATELSDLSLARSRGDDKFDDAKNERRQPGGRAFPGLPADRDHAASQSAT